MSSTKKPSSSKNVEQPEDDYVPVNKSSAKASKPKSIAEEPEVDYEQCDKPAKKPSKSTKPATNPVRHAEPADYYPPAEKSAKCSKAPAKQVYVLEEEQDDNYVPVSKCDKPAAKSVDKPALSIGVAAGLAAQSKKASNISSKKKVEQQEEQPMIQMPSFKDMMTEEVNKAMAQFCQKIYPTMYDAAKIGMFSVCINLNSNEYMPVYMVSRKLISFICSQFGMYGFECSDTMMEKLNISWSNASDATVDKAANQLFQISTVFVQTKIENLCNDIDDELKREDFGQTTLTVDFYEENKYFENVIMQKYSNKCGIKFQHSYVSTDSAQVKSSPCYNCIITNKDVIV